MPAKKTKKPLPPEPLFVPLTPEQASWVYEACKHDAKELAKEAPKTAALMTDIARSIKLAAARAFVEL